MGLINTFIILVGLIIKEQISADVPCVPKFYNESSVCVCNATYCDTITRRYTFEPGTFMTYTSSKEGKRFYKQLKMIRDRNLSFFDESAKVFEIDPNVRYQKIEGFGGAVTDAAGINLKSLPLAAQQKLINSYFSESGIEYNMLRVPIASTDFSTRIYTYDDTKDDTKLINFSLAEEDFKYKIPIIQRAKEVATDKIQILSATWTPPAWMKTTNSIDGGEVKPEYYQVFSDYHCKFLEAYKQFDIDIWAFSTPNEPTNPLLGADFQTTLWRMPDMGNLISQYFGPTIKKCSRNKTKILTINDQRGMIPLFSALLSFISPESLNYVDGFALHSYFNKITPASMATFAFEQFPDKFAIVSEYCRGSPTDLPRVNLGSWDRGKDYTQDILENLNSNFVAWIDWNLCLNGQGGPNWIENFVDSPIIVDAENEEFYKQPMFYAMGHFSKFVPRGSQRIKMSAASGEACDKCNNKPSKEYAAFMTPENTIVIIIYNDGEARDATMRVGTCDVVTQLDADSITTIEVPTVIIDNYASIDCKIIVNV